MKFENFDFAIVSYFDIRYSNLKFYGKKELDSNTIHIT